MARDRIRVSGGYELLDHTADAGLRVRAPSLEELFQGAAHAFYDLMADRATVGEREFREVVVDAPELDELLVAWLSELLFLFETEGFLGRSAQVVLERGEGWTLRGRVAGETLDSGCHEVRLLCKAVTYHQLKVERDEEGWEAQVIFDV